MSIGTHASSPAARSDKMGANVQPGLTEYASNLIAHKAKQLVGRYGFACSDCADLEQELVLHLIQQMKHFDPQRGAEQSFVGRVLSHKVASIIRHRRAGRRDYRRVTSIDDAAGGGEHTVIAALAAAESPHDLAIDLAGAIQRLDPDSQHFCSLIMTGSVVEAARRLGLTRGAARGRVAILRKLLTGSGIDTYVNHGRANPRGHRVCNR
jgi:RNA polymerase sigma-70 factor (ECF subfamily)